MTERERDERDLEILSLLKNGATIRQASEMFGVEYDYIKRLKEEYDAV